MVHNFKEFVNFLFRLGHRSTAVLDAPRLKEAVECRWPPVFVLGPPRSGTSLFYQLLVSAFQVSYIPNISNTFYQCPIFAARLGRFLCRDHRTDYTSRYGFEKGCLAPSEGGNIWNRWFPFEKREGFNYTRAGYLTEEIQLLIYRFIAQFEMMNEAPFLTKNGKFCVRIPVSTQIFPDAIFVEIERDLIDSAMSILIRRRKSRAEWWSVMPKEINQIRKVPELEQVVQQVYFIKRNITEDIRQCAPGRIFTLKYEDLCRNPVHKLEEIQCFLAEKGCPLIRKPINLPNRFSPSKPPAKEWLTSGEIEEIERLCKELTHSRKDRE